ncbi:MAG: sugar ABC transporter substrate-binding protein [Lachnospiraceae bacterium]|nr:sugar ABC transporter substrate-binding protein [Lachnospiraceae bacterium]
MKQKIVSLLMGAVMVASLVSGCGGATQQAAGANDQPKEAAATEAAATEAPAEEAKEEGAEAKEETADSGDKIKIKWAMWDDTIEYWEDLEEAFEASHPNIEVERVDFGSQDYDNVLAIELSGDGTEFDVATIKDIGSYATLIEKGAIDPLEDYIAKDNVDLSKFSGVTDQILADGKLYEMPFRSDIWVLYYNKAIFDAAGVDYPSNDMTWKEYDELARKVTSTEFGNNIYGAHYHTWNSCVQLLGTLDGKHSVLDKNYDFMIPFYDMVLAEEKDGVCQKYSDLKAEGLHYSAAFANGNVAMTNNGSWFITTLLSKLASGEFDPELCGNWGIASYPHAEGVEAGTTLGQVTGMSIVSQSDQKDAAWEFINWCSGEEGAKVLASSGTFPAISNDEITGIISSLEGFPQDEQTKDALKVKKMYLETPYGKDLAAISEILGTYHDMIMAGEVSVADGVKAMNEEAAKIQ